MTNKHYKWQHRWCIDAAAQTAHHDTGLLVRFSVPPGTIGARGLANNECQVIKSLEPKHGHNAAAMVQRLLREAREIYASPPR
jgi:hypothetical protein